MSEVQGRARVGDFSLAADSKTLIYSKKGFAMSELIGLLKLINEKVGLVDMKTNVKCKGKK